MNDSFLTNRRKFIKGSAAAGALSFAPGSIRAANKASNFIRVGVIGLSRGVAHVRRFAETSGVEVAYVCDVDEKRIARGTKALKAGNAKGVTDFRRILEDDEVDVLSIAAPNFWHSPAAILAMEAGKHVYVEKPGSHNMAEADMIVAASRKYDRRVQMGNQRRSYPNVREAMQRLHEGVIGKVLSARSWYNNRRGSIGKGKPAKPPEGLNYELWGGPTPHKPYVDNLVHYNWHWRWHWGGGKWQTTGFIRSTWHAGASVWICPSASLTMADAIIMMTIRKPRTLRKQPFTLVIAWPRGAGAVATRVETRTFPFASFMGRRARW